MATRTTTPAARAGHRGPNLAPGEGAPGSILADTTWLADRLDDPRIRVVEVDEDPGVYRNGHIPGAHLWRWREDLNDDVRRDFVDGPRLEALLERTGIGADTTLVLYGDRANWFATYAYWLLTLRGVPNVRVLDGGRIKWEQEQRPLTTEPPAPRVPTSPLRLMPTRAGVRAFRADVQSALDEPDTVLVDVRSPEEYRGDLIAMPGYPQEGAMRGGHIPRAVNVPWAKAAREDGTLRPPEELRELYASMGVTPDKRVITYCRIGERSSHTWFVLHEVLGYPDVRNYDGSWTEWGNLVGAPIERGRGHAAAR